MWKNIELLFGIEAMNSGINDPNAKEEYNKLLPLGDS